MGPEIILLHQSADNFISDACSEIATFTLLTLDAGKALYDPQPCVGAKGIGLSGERRLALENSHGRFYIFKKSCPISLCTQYENVFFKNNKLHHDQTMVNISSGLSPPFNPKNRRSE